MRLPLIVLPLALLAAVSCGAHQRTNDEFLKDCWGAVARSEGEAYELRFEALAIVATEGGTFARSRVCPDHRLWFSRFEPLSDKQLEPIRDAAVDAKGLGLGFQGTAIVVPFERKHEHNLGVRVIALPHLERMTEIETQQFIARFGIG